MTVRPTYMSLVRLQYPIRSHSSLPHRPTKAELLASANGFSSRLKIRAQLLLMKQVRPFTFNDVSAMFSWVFVGHTVWLLVGTTSFVSLALWSANTLQFQEWIAYRVGEYLTSSTGINVVFESAIVPNWKDGKISFKNVSVSRMPHTIEQRLKLESESGVENLDTMKTMEERQAEVAHSADKKGFWRRRWAMMRLRNQTGGKGDEGWLRSLKQYMWFDLTIGQVDVTLNLMRWLDGKGLVQDAEVKGVRGTIDRRHIKWDPNTPWDPVAARTKYTPGDFELEQFHLEDMLVTIYQPQNFRPYSFAVFNADLSTFRKQWVFYDILTADSITGTFDKCLFSVHTPLVETALVNSSDGHGFTTVTNHEFANLSPVELKRAGYKRKTRLRIDHVSVDHLNRGVSGPFGWLTSANIDIAADIYIPIEATEARSSEVLQQLARQVVERIELPESIVVGVGKIENKISLHPSASSSDKQHTATENETPAVKSEPKFIMDLDIRFNDAKASVPLLTTDLTYLNNAMIRPIVGYINRVRTIVPIKSRIVMDLSNFDGSWTAYDSTLLDRVSESVGVAFVNLTLDQAERNKRLKRVGLWGIQEVTRNVLSVYDYARGSRGFWHYLGAASGPIGM